MKKRVILTVINDLVTDQRVDRTARVLTEMGYEVLMVGRQKSDSMRMPSRPYEVHRMRLLFEKGPLFYAEYNLRLFFFLVSQKADLLFSNDLDTLLPDFLHHKLRRIPIIYDSHEYFTETPEVINRPIVMKFWKMLEKSMVPHLKYCITVNQSIADLFKEKYGNNFTVVRNIPASRKKDHSITRLSLGLPENKKIILLQGAGINVQRGAEEAVEAMQFVENAILLIIGGGDVLSHLKDKVKSLHLEEKVIFIPRQTPEKLFGYTCQADLGLTLDKDTNLNYRFSLPNKLFDYIHAGIPVLASPLPEISRIIKEYQIGDFISTHEPAHIASKINSMLLDNEQMKLYRKNLETAASVLNWESESNQLRNLIQKAEEDYAKSNKKVLI